MFLKRETFLFTYNVCLHCCSHLCCTHVQIMISLQNQYWMKICALLHWKEKMENTACWWTESNSRSLWNETQTKLFNTEVPLKIEYVNDIKEQSYLFLYFLQIPCVATVAHSPVEAHGSNSCVSSTEPSQHWRASAASYEINQGELNNQHDSCLSYKHRYSIQS